MWGGQASGWMSAAEGCVFGGMCCECAAYALGCEVGFAGGGNYLIPNDMCMCGMVTHM